jgi:hypothetical protein
MPAPISRPDATAGDGRDLRGARRSLARVALALCGGALLGAIAVALVLIFAGAPPRAGGGEAAGMVPSNLLFAYFVFLFTAPVALAVGLPAYYVLTRWRRLNAISVGLVGIAAGAGVGLLLERGWPSTSELLVCSGIGLVCALAAHRLLSRAPMPPRIRSGEEMG